MMRICTVILLVALCGCSRAERLSEQPSKAASQIESWVPLGTSLSDARQIMQQHRFTCSVVTNGSFEELRGADYLYCDYSASGTVRRRWQAALVLVEGKVSAIRVTTGLIGQ
jgi:hypothetical protein